MQELDPLFNEGSIGFSKFSKFLTEASSRGLVALKKRENGQYGVSPPSRVSPTNERDQGQSQGSNGGQKNTKSAHSRGGLDQSSSSDDPLKEAYQLLVAVLEDFQGIGHRMN